MILGEVDELVALEISVVYLGAVAPYYNDFSPVEDDEIIRLMAAIQVPFERVRGSV